MVNVYRCVITFTADEYKDTPPSNIFLRAETPEIAIQGATSTFVERLRAHGIPQAQFNVKVYTSSQEEVEAYKVGIQSGQVSQQVH